MCVYVDAVARAESNDSLTEQVICMGMGCAYVGDGFTGTAPELVYELAAAAQRMGCVPVAAVEQHRQALLTAVRRCVDMHASRTPLRMHPKRQEALRVFNPKFEEEGYVPGRDYDPDKIRAEQRKLKKIIKKEQKGAARELRKDNYFLADEKAKEVAVYEEGRTQKTNEVMAMLQVRLPRVEPLWNPLAPEVRACEHSGTTLQRRVRFRQGMRRVSASVWVCVCVYVCEFAVDDDAKLGFSGRPFADPL